MVRVIAPIGLVDLVGVAARRFGLTPIATTTDYARVQELARALYDRNEALAGLRRRGREAGSISVVLTDQTPTRSLFREVDLPITDPSVWPRIARAARRCGVRVV